MYKILSDGYTKNEINNSTTSYYNKQQQNLTYLIHIKGISFPKDTKFFTPSMPPQVLKTILGHSSLAMTMDLYSHVLPDTKADEMEKIAKAF